MNYQGHIEAGVVVFDEPVALPDGTPVRVEALTTPPALPAPDEFWRKRTIEQLMAQQSISAPQRWEDVVGQGAALWDDDRQFDEFLRGIRDRRHEGISARR